MSLVTACELKSLAVERKAFAPTGAEPPMIVPDGVVVPPLPYLFGLVLLLAAVGAAFAARRPPVGERQVLALVPWMLVGSVAHVLYVVGALPGALRPFAGTPAVYLSVAGVAGVAWVGLDAAGRDPCRLLAAVGAALLLPLLAASVGAAPRLTPLWPGLAVVVAAAVAGTTWGGLRRLRPGVAATGGLGPLVVFAHALDGVSTAVGVDVLGFGERTPLSRLILDVGAALPGADVLGTGWPFVVVKVALAAFIVVVLAEPVRDESTEGYAMAALVVAVGLGPAVHNLVLFSVAG
jgi:uncharacterized membrane protein